MRATCPAKPSSRSWFSAKGRCRSTDNCCRCNLPFSADEDELRKIFEEFGPVDATRIVRDRDTNAARGFGFVDMVRREDAEAAIDRMNGSELGGRQLVVNEARPRTRR
ncbi:MAG: RNA-binding protein [Armatimonadetes bacterium]|nr:RNA-binding protein [Armatimonadota bacterium]